MENEENSKSEELVKIFNINGEQVMFEYDVAEFFKTTVDEILRIYKQNPPTILRTNSPSTSTKSFATTFPIRILKSKITSRLALQIVGWLC